jgi:hypothetical protein
MRDESGGSSSQGDMASQKGSDARLIAFEGNVNPI